MFLLVVALILFVLLVALHEFGHYLAAKRGGVEVEEYGLGFPPTAKVLAKRKGTVYTLNWLPLGGFVKLKGEYDSAKGKGSYGSAKLSTKVMIMLAGVAMNLVIAFVMLLILALVGMPKLIDNQFTVARDTKVLKQEVLIGGVAAGSPAEAAGLKTNDQIVSIAAPTQAFYIQNSDQLPDITKQLAGQKVEINYIRNKDLHSGTTTLRSSQEVEASQKTSDHKSYLGIATGDFELDKSTWSAPIVALGLMKQFTVLTYQGLGSAVSGLLHRDLSQATSEVSGPVGIFILLKDGTVRGYQFILMIIAVISLTLALINVLPIPALDGGRLFVTLLYRALRRPLTQRREELVHGTGMAVLLVLILLITVVDFNRYNVLHNLLHLLHI